MFEEENESLEVRRVELSVNAVERMGDGVRDLLGLKTSLQLKDIVANPHDIVVLCFGNVPNKNMNLARVLREIRCNLLADERVGQVLDGKATIDRVMIGDRDKVHALLEQLSM